MALKVPVLYDSLTEIELADQLSSGDELAFNEIYIRFWKKLLAIAYSHTKDKVASEEIVQEIFVSLWNKRDLIYIQSLSRYLAKAVKFSVFNEKRRKRQIEIEEQSIVLPNCEIGHEVIELRFLQEYVNHIVDELPVKCKMVFRYSREAGRSISEIAELMDISNKTVEAHLTKALKILRVRLSRYTLLLPVWIFFYCL